MASTAKAMLTIAVAVLVAGQGAATWYANGNFEPNNALDSEDWMWQDPPALGEARLYFSVVSSTQQTDVNGKPAVNPNVGLLETQIEAVASERHTAFLGVWRDCNGDGYVGAAESGLREYAAQLADLDACPAVTGPPFAAWPPGAHNYNGWVSEFIPVSRGNGTNGVDARIYRDDDVRIWGDFHRPDERPFQRSCALSPQPRGTYHNVGGIVNYVDCRFDLLGPWNNAMDLVGDPLDLRFADEDDARTGTIGQVPVGGNEHSENAAVYTTDCDAEPAAVVHSGDTLNETPLGPEVPANAQNTSASVPSVSPAPGDMTSPTLAGQLNATNEEILGDCDYDNDFGHDLYSGACAVLVCVAEADFNGVNPNNKLEADWNFGFTTVPRGTAPFSSVPGFNGPAGVPADGGVGMGGSRWLADSTWLSKVGPRNLRIDLDSGGVEIAPAYWLTFYAQLGQATLSRGIPRPSDEIGTYGDWHCGENTSGIHNGWNCDADLWYINPDGTFPGGLAGLAKPGWKYHLRDVDCYDGSIDALGVGVQPAFYGEEPCP